MGPDLVLVGFGSDVTHLIEFASIIFWNTSATNQELRTAGRGATWAGVYMAVAIFVYVGMLVAHRFLEPPKSGPDPVRFWRNLLLAGVFNLMGIAVMVAVLAVRRLRSARAFAKSSSGVT